MIAFSNTIVGQWESGWIGNDIGLHRAQTIALIREEVGISTLPYQAPSKQG